VARLDDSFEDRADRRGGTPEQVLERGSGGSEFAASGCVEHAEQHVRLLRGYTVPGQPGRPFVVGGDDPKFSDGSCNVSANVPAFAKTAVATFAATIKLTVRR
jgi:hypothetical protein